MKNTKYLFYSVFILFFAMLSCDDNSDIDYSLQGTQQIVQITLSSSRDYTAEEDRFPITITLDQAYDSDAVVVVEFELSDTRTVRKDFVIESGQSSVSDFIFLPGDDGLFNSSSTVPLTDAIRGRAIGFLLEEPSEGVVYIVESNELILDQYDLLPPVVENGGLSYVFIWATNRTDDYDIFSDIPNFNSATGNPLETASVSNDTFSDGNYTLTYNPYAIAGEIDVPFVLFLRVTYNDGTDSVVKFEGTLDALNNDPDLTYDLIGIERTTDSNDLVTYNFQQIEQ